MEKNLSFTSYLFVEDLIDKYGLEDFLLEDDPEFASRFDKNSTPEEKVSAKFLFSKKINESLDNNVPLSEILPSEKLLDIVEELINQEINYEDLPSIIKEDLGVSDEIATNIAQEITNNKKINEDRVNEFIREDFEGENFETEEDSSSIISPSQPKRGLSQELQ